MARRKKKYTPETFSAREGDNKHVRLYRSLLTSEAYKDLSNLAKTIYTLLLLQKDEGKYTVNLPYRDFIDQYGLTKNTQSLAKALESLEEHGFIRIERGRFITGNLKRDANKYTFIDSWKSWSKEKPSKTK